MLLKYHKEITLLALNELFSTRALEIIIAANFSQDNLRGQIGHDEFHFDNNIQPGLEYLETQRRLTLSSLQTEDRASAWAAFGRLTHTAQDFYAHTNYVDLWITQNNRRQSPAPTDISPLVEEILTHPDLRTGKLYYPWEALSFIPVFKRIVTPLLPRDSHAWMNLDSPARGPKFTYAFEAAVKRTRAEFDKTVNDLPSERLNFFLDCRK